MEEEARPAVNWQGEHVHTCAHVGRTPHPRSASRVYMASTLVGGGGGGGVPPAPGAGKPVMPQPGWQSVPLGPPVSVTASLVMPSFPECTWPDTGLRCTSAPWPVTGVQGAPLCLALGPGVRLGSGLGWGWLKTRESESLASQPG